MAAFFASCNDEETGKETKWFYAPEAGVSGTTVEVSCRTKFGDGVLSSAQAMAKSTHGSDFPFPVICDGPGVLYGYLGVEQTRGLLSWSFAAQKIYKAARDAGYHYDTKAPQLLPLTLVVGHLGKILFTH